jgi:hypothetical protein
VEVDQVHEEGKSRKGEDEKDQRWNEGGNREYEGCCEPNGGG